MVTKKEIGVFAVRLLALYALVDALLIAEASYVGGMYARSGPEGYSFPSNQLAWPLIMLCLASAVLWVNAERLAERLWPRSADVVSVPSLSVPVIVTASVSLLGLWLLAAAVPQAVQMAIVTFNMAQFRGPTEEAHRPWIALQFLPTLLRIAIGFFLFLKPKAFAQFMPKSE